MTKKQKLKSIKVCVTDDHLFVRDAMVKLIETFPRVSEVYAAADGELLINSIPIQRPNIVLLDVKMPVMDGVEAADIILKKYREVKILILTMNDDKEVMMKLLEMGVHGYITKSSPVEVVEKAIYQVMDEGYFYADEVSRMLVDKMRADHFLRPKDMDETSRLTELTKREIEIVRLVCKEESNESICKQLDISSKTLLTHKANIYKKVGAKSLISLYQFALKVGIVDK